MDRAINQQWILADDADKRFFVDGLARFKPSYSLNVYHWAVMANHFHLAIETLTVTDLSMCRQSHAALQHLPSP